MCTLFYTSHVHNIMYTHRIWQSRAEQSVRVGAGLYRNAGARRALSRQTQDTAGFELLWQRLLARQRRTNHIASVSVTSLLLL